MQLLRKRMQLPQTVCLCLAGQPTALPRLARARRIDLHSQRLHGYRHASNDLRVNRFCVHGHLDSNIHCPPYLQIIRGTLIEVEENWNV